MMVQDPYSGGAGAGGVGASALPGTAEYFKANVGDTVLFAVDQSTLSPEARATLSGQAGWLSQNQGFSAVIEGHADEQGTREYNIALGARRASSVQEYLISQGIPPGRLRTVSYGKERPLAVCSTEECYSQNRRAVTVVAPGAGM
nr:peptidoglycan-associated lipoprotein Pal [Paracoccus halophilus]